MAERLGARTFILELTYIKICIRDFMSSNVLRTGEQQELTVLRAASNRSAKLQARSMAFHWASVSLAPDVVVAVTTTLIIIAGGRTP
jgi:hypothetical protein